MNETETNQDLLAAARFSECVSMASESIEQLERTGDVSVTNFARYQRANALYRLGRFREAALEAERLYYLGAELGDCQACGISLDVWMRAAPAQVPREYVEEQAGIERGDVQIHVQSQLALALLRWRQNRLDEAARILGTAIQRSGRGGRSNAYISPCYAWLATVHRSAAASTSRERARLFDQRLQLAERAARRACNVAVHCPADLPHALRERGRIAALAGSHARARNCYRRSAQAAGRLSCAMEEYQSLHCLQELAFEMPRGRLGLTQREECRLRELREQLPDSIALLELPAADDEAISLAALQELNAKLQRRAAERTAYAEHKALELNAINRELRATEEQLREAISVAASARQAKNQFLATMSHEIRTPLNGILGVTQLALGANPRQQQAFYLKTIERSGESLLRLLNDLLDFSKIEAGKMTSERIPIDPRKLLSEALDVLSINAWQKGIELVAHLDASLPTHLMGDEVRLRQVILNLVGNAIKFTSRGHIEVRAEVIGDAPDAVPRWRIQVIDTGIGIPIEKQATIFEAFSQADNSTTRRFGGTGLGLSISRGLVELMGGAIEVSSRDGAGSEFSILLPLLTFEQEGVGSVPRFRVPGVRVLVVEPNEAARRSLHSILESWGTRTIAIRRWADLDPLDRPHLKLFDIVIAAGPDAADVLESARECGVAGWLAHGLNEFRSATTSCLTKPIFPDALENQMRRFLSERYSVQHCPIKRGSGECDHLASAAASLETEHSEMPGGGLNVLVAEDGAINQLVLVGLLELQGHRTTVAQNGRQASRLALRGVFDVCLMDLDMPEMDGIEATKLIRKTNDTLMIVAMTAHHDERHAQMCGAAGMNFYLTKPINPTELNDILGTISGNGCSAKANFAGILASADSFHQLLT